MMKETGQLKQQTERADLVRRRDNLELGRVELYLCDTCTEKCKEDKKVDCADYNEKT